MMPEFFVPFGERKKTEEALPALKEGLSCGDCLRVRFRIEADTGGDCNSLHLLRMFGTEDALCFHRAFRNFHAKEQAMANQQNRDQQGKQNMNNQNRNQQSQNQNENQQNRNQQNQNQSQKQNQNQSPKQNQNQGRQQSSQQSRNQNINQDRDLQDE